MAGQGRLNARLAGGALAALLAFGAAADWVGHADFTACPRDYFPDTHAQERFASREQCEARIAQVKRDMPNTCARYWCADASGVAGGGTKGGQPLDSHIQQAISAGLQGQISAGDAASLVGMGMLGNALLGSMAGDSPEEKARKAAARQARLEREAAIAAQRRAQDDARAVDLLGAMLDDDAPDAAAAPARQAGTTLGADDDGCDAPLGMMCDDAPLSAAAPPAAVPVAAFAPPSATALPAPLPFDAFAKGYEHATSCISQNGGVVCATVGPGQFEGCVAEYRNGYGEGDKGRKLRIMKAYNTGGADKLLGRPSNGFNLPDAEGPCRVDIIQAYNSGYQGVPPPP
jgi:hypothetical protein